MVIKKCVYSKKEKILVKSENYKDILGYLNQFDRIDKIRITYSYQDNKYICEIKLKEECYNGW